MQADTGSGDASTPPLKARVGEVLEEIREAIRADGGDVELVDVGSDGVVSVRFHGACVGCSCAGITLSQGIERVLKARVPEVTGVVLA